MFVKKRPYTQLEDPIIQSIARSQLRKSAGDPIHGSILESIGTLRRVTETDTFRMFLEWLSPSVRSSYSIAFLEEELERQVPGTGEWLIRNHEFKNWEQEPNSFFLLQGKGDIRDPLMIVAISSQILSGLGKDHA